MTISVAANKITWLGNGATTVFAYAFAIPTANEAALILTDSLGNQTTIGPAAFTITGVGQPTAAGGPQGGTVTYPLTGSPIAAGTTLTLMRVLPYQQPNSFVNQGGLWPDVVETSDDNLCMQVQQLAEQYGRALTVNAADITPITTLPSAAARAGLIMGFDSLGNPAMVANGAQTGDVSITTALLAGTPSVRSLSLRFAERLSVKDFGAFGNGVTDDSAAVSLAINYVAANGGALYFPPGKYIIGSRITASLAATSAIQITGAGRELTELNWPNANGGLLFNFVASGNWTRQNGNLLSFADMAFTTAVTNGGTAIYVSGGTATGEPVAATTFRNLSFRGTTPSGTAQWTNAIYLADLGTVTFWDISIFGADLTAATASGITIAGLTGHVITQFVMFGVSCTFLAVAVNIGDFVQGVMITGCNFSWVNVGVQFVAATGLQNQCSIVNTQIQAFQYCVTIQNSTDNQINGNTFYIGNQYPGVGTHFAGGAVGVELASSGRTQVIGNSFAGTAADDGIVVGNPGLQPLSAMASSIDGNSFAGMAAAIILQANTSGVTIGSGNSYSSTMAARFSDAGIGNIRNPMVWSGQQLIAVGSGTTATIAIPVPAGVFSAAPAVAFAAENNPGAEQLLCWYVSGSSTATSLIFLVSRRDGTSITGANYTFNAGAIL